MIKELMHDPIFLAGKSESSTEIIKLVYKHERLDLMQLKISTKIVYTITPDGKLTIKEYKNGSRKVHSLNEYSFSLDEYRALCKGIEECIKNANRLDFYVDGTSEELKILHKYGREQIMDRGLGNEYVHIYDIIHDFLDGVMNDD